MVLPTVSDTSKKGSFRCEFAGWYTNEDLSGYAVTVITSDTSGDLMFYAEWNEAFDTGKAVAAAVASSMEVLVAGACARASILRAHGKD